MSDGERSFCARCTRARTRRRVAILRLGPTATPRPRSPLSFLRQQALLSPVSSVVRCSVSNPKSQVDCGLELSCHFR
jgi:hypothetical protein